MLEISPEQMVVADDIARDNFHQRVRDYVREKLPEETSQTPDSKLLAYIAEQELVARKHKIETELGIARWVCLGLWTGEDFYQQPEFKDYFEQPGEPPAEIRLELYVDYICALENNPDAKVENTIRKHGYLLGAK